MNLKQKQLSSALASAFLSLGIGAPLPTLPAAMQINGALVEPASLQAFLSMLVQGQIAEGSVGFNTNATAAVTLTSLQGLIQRLTNGGATVVTLDYAYNIVNQLYNPFVGMSFPMNIAATGATTVATPTLSDTAVTLSGTTSVLAAAMRWYQGLVTQVVTTSGAPVTSGTTFTSLTQVGTTNAYTLVLGTNALSPTVGQAIFLNVTAGTLPSGWYPIAKVNSATSLVIVAPLAGTAFTATAGTVPGTTVIPTSQYTPGLLGVYSPLLTITGMLATATAVITV